MKTVQLSSPRRAVAYVGLDSGEAAVLAVAEERDARLVVIDEKRARRFAERMGFALTGTLGVLTAGPIARLQESGLFLSQDLVRQALRLAGEEL